MSRENLVLDVPSAFVLWAIAAARDFDTFVVVIADLWTLRILMFERRGYRLITRGRIWRPSKNPAEFR